MSRWYFVRHGEPDWPAIEARGLQGAVSDLVPLTSRGVGQAERVAAQLSSSSAVRVLSSPATRALQTAAIIAQHLDLPFRVHLDLREWVPDLSHQWSLAVVERAAREYRERDGEWPTGEQRGWETATGLRARALGALRSDSGAIGPTIVVAHEMLIGALTGRTEVGLCEVVPVEAQDLPEIGR